MADEKETAKQKLVRVAEATQGERATHQVNALLGRMTIGSKSTSGSVALSKTGIRWNDKKPEESFLELVSVWDKQDAEQRHLSMTALSGVAMKKVCGELFDGLQPKAPADVIRTTAEEPPEPVAKKAPTKPKAPAKKAAAKKKAK